MAKSVRRAPKKHDRVPGNKLDGVLGMWLNKRQLTALEIPMRHRIIAEQGGWRLEVLDAGKLIARGIDGRMRIDVEPGDELVSSGDDFYLSLTRAPEEELDEEEPQEEEPKGEEPVEERPDRDETKEG